MRKDKLSRSMQDTKQVRMIIKSAAREAALELIPINCPSVCISYNDGSSEYVIVNEDLSRPTINIDVCLERGKKGVLGLSRLSPSFVIFFVYLKSHPKDDYEELVDTVRHEMYHCCKYITAGDYKNEDAASEFAEKNNCFGAFRLNCR